MPEMIIPGTYIEVRAEGLIVPGPFSIGNVGIVGTARRGKLGNPPPDPDAPPPTVYTPANIGEARDIFGRYDAFEDPDREEGASELTLVRAMELAYANGAQRVFAVRVATAGAARASYTLPTDGDPLRLEAVAPGDGYNEVPPRIAALGLPEEELRKHLQTKLRVEQGSEAGVVNVTFDVDSVRETWRDVPAAVADFAQVIGGTDLTYAFRTLASTGGGSDLFEVTEEGSGNVQPMEENERATQDAQGTNGADAGPDEYQDGLEALLNQDVQIIVLAGQGGDAMETSLTSHVENASTDLMKRERIGVIGSTSLDDLEAPAQDTGRLIFVAPGVEVYDPVADRQVPLPGTYAAAAVAGRISSLDPHFSPTNKTIIASGLETDYNGTQLEQLLLGRVLALESRNGTIRIVRGLTTSTNTAWAQITTRRIVDFARFGVRAAANPFIGKLNNPRVRQALKGSINSLLADMVDREMLISYELDVSATRPQQIRGIAQVTMFLRPTFSIDFIRVVMYLE